MPKCVPNTYDDCADCNACHISFEICNCHKDQHHNDNTRYANDRTRNKLKRHYEDDTHDGGANPGEESLHETIVADEFDIPCSYNNENKRREKNKKGRDHSAGYSTR